MKTEEALRKSWVFLLPKSFPSYETLPFSFPQKAVSRNHCNDCSLLGSSACLTLFSHARAPLNVHSFFERPKNSTWVLSLRLRYHLRHIPTGLYLTSQTTYMFRNIVIIIFLYDTNIQYFSSFQENYKP